MTESARAITELGILVVIASAFLGGTIFLFRKYFKKQDEQNQIKEKWINALQERLNEESQTNHKQTVVFVESVDKFTASFAEMCRHQDLSREKAIAAVDRKWMQVSEDINTRMMERLAVAMGERDNNLQKVIQKVDMTILSNTNAVDGLKESIGDILKEVRAWQE